MKTKLFGLILLATGCVLLSVALVACKEGKADEKAAAPPPAVVIPDMDANSFKVDHPERFPLATAGEYKAAPELNVTGVVSPDISRTVPVISLATGKVVEIHTRLGDVVKKGQLLLRVQSSDVAGAYSDYRKAVNDEKLTRVQFERAQLLFDQGAIAKSALENFDDAEQDAKVTRYCVEHEIVVLAGALTPTEVMLAFEAGADFVKVFPIADVGGERYIRALKAPFAHVPLVAAGGVTQTTAPHFIHAGAVALGVGEDLIPRQAIRFKEGTWIQELAARFVAFVRKARAEME
jgi:hypothetical protein